MECAREFERPHVVWTRRRLLGQSRPRRLGRHPPWDGHEKELKGGEAATTNNRMELMAAIAALRRSSGRAAVDIYTDSQYLRRRHHGVDRRLEAQRLAHRDRKPVKNVRPVAARSTTRSARTRSLALGRGHAGTT